MTIHTNATVRRARRIAVARALQSGAGQECLVDWQAIDSAPLWLTATTTEEARQRLCARAGGWWLAASLYACIDGKRLERACAALGQEVLTGIRSCVAQQRSQHAVSECPVMPLPPLPAAEKIEIYLHTCGRALLVWGLAPVLRAPILTYMHWAVDEAHYIAFERHATWAHKALSLVVSPEEPSPADMPSPVCAPVDEIVP